MQPTKRHIEPRTGPLPVTLETGTLRAGARLTFAPSEDVALILRGRIACATMDGPSDPMVTTGSDLPTIVLVRDCDAMLVVALSDVSVVKMGTGSCRLLIATSARFRTFYQQAISSRINALLSSYRDTRYADVVTGGSGRKERGIR